MNPIENFAEKHDGYYEEENIKNIFSTLGRMVYHPKKAKFLIDGSKISVNIDEVGGAIPTAEPYRVTLHLNKNKKDTLEIYPITPFEKFFQQLVAFRNKKLKENYLLKGNKKLIEQLVSDKLFIEALQKEKVYIRIPKDNTSKIILTPPFGIENSEQLECIIKILKRIEVKI